MRPRRNDNITKLYTGGFEKENTKVNYKLKPNDELTNPKKVTGFDVFVNISQTIIRLVKLEVNKILQTLKLFVLNAK